MSATELDHAMRRLESGQSLSRTDARDLFHQIMEGAVPTERLIPFLRVLAEKGECADEIVGAAEAMRARVTRVRTPADRVAIDTCGTGGDGKPTFNVSSAVAVVTAACNVTVAKHGNRSHARPSGSAEGLRALGIDVEADVPVLEACLASCNVAFLYATRLHPAMKHAAEARRAIRTRTIFNLVGPLTNPACVDRQLLGVSRPEHVELLSEALRTLGAERAMVVHGEVGLCDLSIDGPTRIACLDAGRIELRTVDSRDFDVAPAALESLFIESPQASASLIEAMLRGAPGPAREMVVLNASAALWVAGVESDWPRAADRARRAIDSGDAYRVLERWRAVSNANA